MGASRTINSVVGEGPSGRTPFAFQPEGGQTLFLHLVFMAIPFHSIPVASFVMIVGENSDKCTLYCRKGLSLATECVKLFHNVIKDRHWLLMIFRQTRKSIILSF